MLPVLRAAADQFIFDIATLKHVADLAGDEGLERSCEATGWTVRQTLIHLAASMEGYAEVLEPASGSGQPAVEFGQAMPTVEIFERYDRARDRVIAAFERFDATRPAANPPVFATIGPWVDHIPRHSIDLLEALPGVRIDSLVLTWAMFHDFGGDPAWLARRRAIVKVIREEYEAARPKRKRKKKED